MSTGKAAGCVLVGVLAGVLIGMAVEQSRAAGRLAVPADLPDPCTDGEQATAVPPRYVPVPLADTPPVRPVDTPAVPPGDTVAPAQVMRGVPGTNTLAERVRASQPVQMARHLIRRVRRYLATLGPAAGAQALVLVELFASIWRRKTTAGRWPVWVWVPTALVPTGARGAEVRAELVAAVRTRPVRGPAGPAERWPLPIGGFT